MNSLIGNIATAASVIDKSAGSDNSIASVNFKCAASIDSNYDNVFD